MVIPFKFIFTKILLNFNSKMRYYIVGFILLTLFNQKLNAQGNIVGNFRLNMDFYDRDTSIRAIGPNYEYNKSSANAWMQTIYTNSEYGIEAAIRFDGNYNSILQNPPKPISFYGIGNWYIKKKIDNLQVTAGYIYEQYGSGVALRTFEERNLGIDNALFGIKASYKFSDNLSAKAIAGTQKFQLRFLDAFVKGFNIEYNKDINDSFGFNMGGSIVNRTLTLEDRETIDKEVATYPNSAYFQTPYNNTVFNLYNTTRYKSLTWYLEGAYLTSGALFNALLANDYFNKPGYSIMSSITFIKPKLGVTIQNRMVENFQFQSTQTGAANDFNLNNNRRLSFLAPINKQNSLRLPARFQIAPNEIGEIANSIDITYSFSKKVVLNFNYSMIDTIGWKDPYYKEAFIDIEYKKLFNGKLDNHFGFQYIYYNQRRYLGGNEPTNIQSYTFFLENTLRLSRKKSIRTELQYQDAKLDIGKSIFALIEYNIAPSWSFSISDLYTFQPNPHYEVVSEYQKPHHFYSLFASYTKNTTRFTLAYAKQLAGIVCTGGVCRFEPAFSGLRAQLTTSF